MSLGNPGPGALDGEDVDQAGQPVLGQTDQVTAPHPGRSSAPGRDGGGRPPGTQRDDVAPARSARRDEDGWGQAGPSGDADLQVMGAGHGGGLFVSLSPARAAGRAHHRRRGVRDGSACASRRAGSGGNDEDRRAAQRAAGEAGRAGIERALGARGSLRPPGRARCRAPAQAGPEALRGGRGQRERPGGSRAQPGEEESR